MGGADNQSSSDELRNRMDSKSGQVMTRELRMSHEVVACRARACTQRLIFHSWIPCLQYAFACEWSVQAGEDKFIACRHQRSLRDFSHRESGTCA